MYTHCAVSVSPSVTPFISETSNGSKRLQIQVCLFQDRKLKRTFKAAMKTAHMRKTDASWLGYVIRSGGSIQGQMKHITDKLNRKPYNQDQCNMGKTQI